MNRTYINDVKQSLDGKEVLLNGWIHEIRDQSKIKFILLRDISGIIQLVSKQEDKFFNDIVKIPRESVVEIKGIVKKSNQAPNGIEVFIKDYKILNEAENLPIPIVEKGDSTTSLPKRLDYRSLDLHNLRTQAIFKIQSEIANSFRRYFYENGFIEIQPPCIISSASEGGTELFKVKYFEKDAYLAQSPQLYKQMCVTSLEKVTMIVPVWRAEKHNTIRHINETRQMDIEMAFADEFTVMEQLSKCVQYIVKNVIEKCENELDFLKIKLKVPKDKYLTYTETIKLLNKNGLKLEDGDDLSPESERRLCELFKDTIVFVHDWPLKIKPFYIMPKTLDKNEKLSRGFDAIYGGIEISSGGQRVHLVNILIKQLKDKKLNPDNFEHYINAFKYGAPQHGGWSIGLERFTMALLGLDNIREGTLFPRDRDRLIP
ncbi:aspartate--tRNA(Asn) ligase [Candidatus Woesearchaeota archaeon]|nr:aspartate--tRNA(Asn) ligase [Candidatus Woesearchaeota archaeon]